MSLILFAGNDKAASDYFLELIERYSNVKYHIYDEDAALSDIPGGIHIHSCKKPDTVEGELKRVVDMLVLSGLPGFINLSDYKKLSAIILPVEYSDSLVGADHSIQYITCGRGEKDTVSLSSNLSDNRLISIRRGMRTLDGQEVTTGEQRVEISSGRDIPLLLAYAAAVMCGAISV
ncbi:MAG: hypothetical protein AB9835_03890 [Eubacteriales bacterium]